MQEQELFNNYEVKTWDFSTRFYKILAVSAVFNILAILVVGQSNLLTKKGCDSPLVEKVCTVIDALYVSGTVMTTDSRTIDEAYTPTEITSEDEIVWVPVDDKLFYPEGYFQTENPESAKVNDATDFPTGSDSTGVSPGTYSTIPGIPNNPTIGNPTVGNPLSKPPILPKRPKSSTTQDLDDFDLGSTENPTIPKDENKRPRVITDPKENPTVAENQNPTNADPNEIVINKKPLKDLVPKVKEKLAGGMVLTAPFVVQAKGKLTKEGKIDKIKFTRSEGADPNLLDVVRSSVAAINDSNYLKYLSLLNGETLDLRFSQDAASIAAVVQSEMSSETRAKSVSGLIQIYLSTSLKDKEKKLAELEELLKANPENAEELRRQIADDSDDLALLKYARVSQEGKRIIIKFEVPQEIAKALIDRKLNAPDAPEVKKPNSAAQVIRRVQNSAK
jgi:hypothetical protein